MSRYIPLALIAIGASVLYGADIGTRTTTIARSCARDGTNYMVNYAYDPKGGGFVPATNPPGEMHYGCIVSVWANGQQVGKDFKGEVTEKGCFEDKPEDMVAKALSQSLQLQIGDGGVAGTPELRFSASLAITNSVMPQSSLTIGYTAVFTNIIFSNSYTGTIQIGTNFWKVGEIGVKVAQDAIDSGQFCAMRGHAVYATRHVWINARGPVDGPAHKCAVCGRLVTQQPGEWK